jgi:hypothetical protein
MSSWGDVLEIIRRLPPWFTVTVVSAALIAGLLALVSTKTGKADNNSGGTEKTYASVVTAGPDPAEVSRTAAEARNAAEQRSYLVAVAHLSSFTPAVPLATQEPPKTGTATAGGKAKTPAAKPTPIPTSSPTFVFLSTNDACVLSVEEVVAIYAGLDAAITDNDAVHQGQLFDQPITDLALISAHAQDQELGAIITGLGAETVALQQVLVTDDSHPATTRFDAQAHQLITYCNTALG